MAEPEEHDEHKEHHAEIKKPDMLKGAGKKKDRDSKILIVVGLLGVVLTFLIYRSSKKSPGVQLAPGTGTVANPGAGQGSTDMSSALQQLGQQLQDQNQSFAQQIQDEFTQGQQAQSDALGGFAQYLTNLTSELSQIVSSPQQAATAPAPAPSAPAAVQGIDFNHPLNVSHENFPFQLESGANVDILGTITGLGGQFTGLNVSGGAPVYANIGGHWQQDFSGHSLPVGTQIATLPQFAPQTGNYQTEYFG